MHRQQQGDAIKCTNMQEYLHNEVGPSNLWPKHRWFCRISLCARQCITISRGRRIIDIVVHLAHHSTWFRGGVLLVIQLLSIRDGRSDDGQSLALTHLNQTSCRITVTGRESRKTHTLTSKPNTRTHSIALWAFAVYRGLQLYVIISHISAERHNTK